MNKKFLSAILFGAMMTASTTVFVSCEDYGDDIAHLQEQIDQNATTAESELAAKVAALQAQLSTLEAAQKSMTEQLAAAKAEVATAAANAAAAAQTAQAAADKAQGGADEAKAAAAAAQAAADKANQTLSEAVARVAVLETKVASLEATIADLSAASKDLNAKLAEVQTLATALKNSTDKNAADIAAFAKQVSELNAELGKVSSTLGARIDAIDKQLNEIKATFDKYVTKSELQAKADVLAAMDAQLQAQIQTNLNYIKEMQAAIASLGDKDKELAAAIEKNYADVLAEIEELATSQAEALAALEAAVKAGDAKLDEAIKAVQAIAEANAAAIKDIQAAIATKADKTAVDALAKDLAQAIADIAEVTADLAAYKTDVAKELSDINKRIDDLYDLAAQIAQTAQANNRDIAALRELNEEQMINIEDQLATLSQTVISNYLYSVSIEEKLGEHLPIIYDQLAVLSQLVQTNQKLIVENQMSIYDLQVTIGEHETKLSDIDGIVSDLSSLAESNYKLIVANQVEIQNLMDKFDATLTDLDEWKTEFEGKYEKLVSDTQKQIADELAKLEALSKNLIALNDDVKDLKEQMAAVLGRIQSIAFVPEYMNANGNVIVPSYFYNQGANIVDGVFKATPIVVKFRVQPAEAAEALATLWADEESRECFALECANELQTRANATGYAVANVESLGNGVIAVTGTTAGNTDNFKNDATYAYTLVIEDALATKKTSDYFNVETQAINLNAVDFVHANGNIEFTNFEKFYPTKDMTINYTTFGGANVKLADLGRASNLRIEAVKVNGNWVSLWANTYKYANGSSVYNATELTSINNQLNNFWTNDANAKYFVPVTAANNNVQVKGLQTGVVVDKYGIGKELELMVVDMNFGRNNTAGQTTTAWGWQKYFTVKHVITENKTATSAYDFNNEGNKLAWRFQEPAGTNHEVFAANGLEWLKYGMSSAVSLKPADATGKINIKEIVYSNGVKANVQQVKTELATVLGTTALKATVGGVAGNYGTVTFTLDGDAVKATVAFNDYIPYGRQYSFTQEYQTVFGKITLTGIVKLNINGETTVEMLEHTINWKDAYTYNLGITNPYVNGGSTLYVPDWTFNKGYANYTNYINEQCTYEWYLLPATVDGGVLTSNDINSVSSTLTTGIVLENDQVKSGYKFNGDKVSFNRYITIAYTKGNPAQNFIAKGSKALANLQFLTVVKDWNGNVVAHEIAKFNYVDPIQAPALADIIFTAGQCKNLANEPLVICEGINVTDIYNQKWYEMGELKSIAQNVWGAKEVTYSIVNAAEVATVAGDLHIDDTDKNAVKIVFSNYQWASDLKVKVKASIEYQYGLVESEFDVTLPANPTLQ